MIDHVIAVGASGPGREVWRRISVRDTQVAQVAGDLGGLIEREPCVKLQAIRGFQKVRHQWTSGGSDEPG